MLDSCPPRKSCGTEIPYWTDATMPTTVGVEEHVRVYGVAAKGCKSGEGHEIKVMRCSWNSPHDFIYKTVSTYYGTCNEAFCGMN